eukprot:7588707-Lingulodinium_polyedra.AAC.1
MTGAKSNCPARVGSYEQLDTRQPPGCLLLSRRQPGLRYSLRLKDDRSGGGSRSHPVALARSLVSPPADHYWPL